MRKKICVICNITFETKSQKRTTCSPECEKSLRAKSRSYMSDPVFRAKLSVSLKRHYAKYPEKIMRGQQAINNGIKGTRGRFRKELKDILEVSARTARKILKRLEIGCSRCGWNEALCDIHHINGKKVADANGHWNLCYLCPNCHRLVHSGKIKKDDLISFDAYVGEKWKDYYYG